MMCCGTFQSICFFIALVAVSIWTSKGNEVDELVQRLFRVIRYYPGFTERFDPLHGSVGLPLGDVPGCHSHLRGLSHMRIANYTHSLTPDNEYMFHISFQYPMLCLLCEPPQRNMSDIPNLEHMYYGNDNDMCAINVTGLMTVKIARNETKLRAEYINLPNRQPFFLQHKISSNESLPGFYLIQWALQSYAQDVRNIINFDIHDEMLEYIGKAYKEAGDCWTGNCTILEDMTAYELANNVWSFMVQKANSSETRFELDTNYTLFLQDDAYKWFAELSDMWQIDLYLYHKVREPRHRHYYVAFMFKHSNLYVKAKLIPSEETNTDSVKMFSLRARNFTTVMMIGVLQDQTEPIKLIDLNVDVAHILFDPVEGCVNMLSPYKMVKFSTAVSKSLAEWMKKFLEETIETFSSKYQDYKNCDIGNCFLPTF